MRLPLSWPYSVAVAPDGTVYVSDTNNHRIQKFTSEGVFIKTWGTQGIKWASANWEFVHPRGVAVASDGNVYVADWFNDRVMKFTADGEFINNFGPDGTADGDFDPLSMAIAPDGSVYVADFSNHRIQKFSVGQ